MKDSVSIIEFQRWTITNNIGTQTDVIGNASGLRNEDLQIQFSICEKINNE